MKLFISTFALAALSALTSDAITVSQDYSANTVVQALHMLGSAKDTSQFMQYVYNGGLLYKEHATNGMVATQITDGPVTVFYPVNDPAFNTSTEPDMRLIDFARYHIVSESIAPRDESARGIVASTMLISPNPDTNMSNGTSQKVILSFTSDSLIAYYGQSQRSRSDLVYNCSNGLIYMIDKPFALPLKPSDAITDNDSTAKIHFGSSAVSDYLNDFMNMTFLTTGDATYNTVDQIKNQIVPVIYYGPDFADGQKVSTAGGQSLSVMSTAGGSLTINNVQVAQTIPVWNGVIHVLSSNMSTIHLNNSTNNESTNTVNESPNAAVSSAAVSATVVVMAALCFAVLY